MIVVPPFFTFTVPYNISEVDDGLSESECESIESSPEGSED